MHPVHPPRATVARLWQEHLDEPWPARLNDAERAGIDLAGLDTYLAGCVRTWLAGDGPLDPWRAGLIRQGLAELDLVLPELTEQDNPPRWQRMHRMVRLVAGEERAEHLADLGALLSSLANRPVVSVRWGRFPELPAADGVRRALADRLHELVAELCPIWDRCHPSGAGLPGPAGIEAALEAIGAATAVELMTTLAADDLVWPGSRLMSSEIAHDTVTDIVNWFDSPAPGTSWWTNRSGRGWRPVSSCTFDGVVAGSDGVNFAILLQLGED